MDAQDTDGSVIKFRQRSDVHAWASAKKASVGSPYLFLYVLHADKHCLLTYFDVSEGFVVVLMYI